MRRHNVLVLTFVLYQSTFLWGMAPENFDNENFDNTEPLSNVSKKSKSITRSNQHATDGRDFALMSFNEIKQQSLKTIQGEVGPRSIPGWTLIDVDDYGNCFYDAVCHQMEFIEHDFLKTIPSGTLPRDSLRLRIQGKAFKDEEWAEDKHIDEFVKKFDLILAVINTLNPENGYTYYYLGDDGDVVTHVPEDGVSLPNKKIIKLAATGNHFLSVVSEACEGEHQTKSLNETTLKKFQNSNHSFASDKISTDQAQNLRTKILSAITITDKRIAEHNPLDTKVIIIGPSSSGKSTLLNLLVNKDLVVDKRLRIDFTNPVQGSKPGHRPTSTTLLPSLCKGPDDIVLCDCPGFEATTGSETDIVNLGMIRKLFSGGVKVLLTVPEKDLSGNGTAFLKQLNYIANMLPYAHLKNSLLLVITKQGELRGGVDPHERLRELLAFNSQDDESSKDLTGLQGDYFEEGYSEEEDYSEDDQPFFLTEEARKLLTYLTNDKNIRERILYFPFPKKSGKYDQEGVRTNILTGIRSLDSIQNPVLDIELSPESRLHVLQLAANLNIDIELSLRELGSKILTLCQEQTKAYTRDGSIEELKVNVEGIRSTLAFLKSNPEENLIKFADSLDYFAAIQKNTVKDCIKSLMFLKTLMNDEVKCLTTAWAQPLKLILDEIQELTDFLGVKLFTKITTFVEDIKISIIQCNIVRPESNEREEQIEQLTEQLKAINEAKTILQNATPETMIDFASSLRQFSSESLTDSIKSFINALKSLDSFNKLNYPKAEWLMYLNSTAEHLENTINMEQKLINFRESERQLQQELITARQKQDEELRARAAAEETARRERDEAARISAEQNQAHQAEVARLAEAVRLAREATERQHLAELEALRLAQADAAARAQREREEILEQQRSQSEATERRLQQSLAEERQRQADEQSRREASKRERQSRREAKEKERVQKQNAELTELTQQLIQRQEEQSNRALQTIDRLTSELRTERQHHIQKEAELTTKSAALRRAEEQCSSLTKDNVTKVNQIKGLQAEITAKAAVHTKQLAQATQEKEKLTKDLAMAEKTNNDRILADKKIADDKKKAAEQQEQKRLNTPITRAQYRKLPANKRRSVDATVTMPNGKKKVVRRYYPL